MADPAEKAESLRAWLDEDYEAAQALYVAAKSLDGRPDFTGTGGPAAETFWDRFTPWRQMQEVRTARMRLGLILEGLEGGRMKSLSDDPATVEAFREGVRAMSRVMLDVETLRYGDDTSGSGGGDG